MTIETGCKFEGMSRSSSSSGAIVEANVSDSDTSVSISGATFETDVSPEMSGRALIVHLYGEGKLSLSGVSTSEDVCTFKDSGSSGIRYGKNSFDEEIDGEKNRGIEEKKEKGNTRWNDDETEESVINSLVCIDVHVTLRNTDDIKIYNGTYSVSSSYRGCNIVFMFEEFEEVEGMMSGLKFVEPGSTEEYWVEVKDIGLSGSLVHIITAPDESNGIYVSSTEGADFENCGWEDVKCKTLEWVIEKYSSCEKVYLVGRYSGEKQVNISEGDGSSLIISSGSNGEESSSLKSIIAMGEVSGDDETMMKISGLGDVSFSKCECEFDH